jgi:hypothetical protein
VAIDASAKAESAAVHRPRDHAAARRASADEGKITLEVKAQGKGLVPDLERS